MIGLWPENIAAERAAMIARITPEARALMAAEFATAGGREIALSLSKQSDGRFGEPRLHMRGHSCRAGFLAHRLLDGDFLIHCHPGDDLTPSDKDLDTAGSIHCRLPATGFAICDTEVERLYIVIEPETPPPSPVRTARVGPLQLRWAIEGLPRQRNS